MTHLDDLNAKARAAFTNRTPAPDPEPPVQFRGTDERHGEWLVTIFPATSTAPASAEVSFRPDEWQTWGAPVQLAAVPVSAWSGRAS
jgi:hypothetical protein